MASNYYCIQCLESVGYGSILYLASIMGIDTSIYEAAEIDGAGEICSAFLKFTIPMVRPTMIILVLLAVGGIFRGNFDLFYNLSEPMARCMM